MRNYRIAVIPGDGTGPEVVAEGLKVLDAVSERCGFEAELIPYDIGGARYLKTGETLPDSVIAELKTCSAIYLGAIGHPDVKPGILEKGILLRARFELDQYINLRPVKLYPGVWTPLKDKGPEQIDFTVVRENTEGIYAGIGGIFKKGTPDEVALQVDLNTRKGVERCIRYAYELTRKRDSEKKKLTLCAKTNVLTYAHDLWARAFEEVGREFPEVKQDYCHVDALVMWMVKSPEFFDVVVTNNMFGDIITDLGAMIQGGLGIAAGGNINPAGVSMFEPIGGSAPKYTGQGVINPLAAIVAISMLLNHIGEAGAGTLVEEAVKQVTGTKIKSLAAGKMGYSTGQVGDLVVASLSSVHPEQAVHPLRQSSGQASTSSG
ncbi:MAG: 3-isopropylmalate dehydrogenase [Candidatus Omnitrophica bacterium]|nr:3-isopropylmalate dehydrogenase [Candidatus Omnitrophota bacterium]